MFRRFVLAVLILVCWLSLMLPVRAQLPVSAAPPSMTIWLEDDTDPVVEVNWSLVFWERVGWALVTCWPG